GLFKFVNISEPNVIEFISSFSDEQGNVCTSPFPMDFPLEVLNKITLAEADGMTTLTLEGHPLNATPEQEETYHSIKDSMHEGFGGTFDKLDSFLKSQNS
ncbi:MAG: SRPBCC domain-containing protein, partial [Proteobacteria bacterium]